MKTKISLLQKIKFPPNHNSVNHTDNGFTLIEMVVVMVIIGILSAIAAPSWVALINRTRLNDAQDRVYQYLRITQTEAKRKKTTLQFQVKVGKVDPTDPNENTLVLAVCPPPANPGTGCSSQYTKEKFLIPGLELVTDPSDTKFTTMKIPLMTSEKVRYIKFNEKGEVVTDNGQTMPAKITMQIENGGTMKRCVIVQTILGAMTTDKDDNCK